MGNDCSGTPSHVGSVPERLGAQLAMDQIIITVIEVLE
jgi:hypothetical protein